jgi:hypothetical protein
MFRSLGVCAVIVLKQVQDDESAKTAERRIWNVNMS